MGIFLHVVFREALSQSDWTRTCEASFLSDDKMAKWTFWSSARQRTFQIVQTEEGLQRDGGKVAQIFELTTPVTLYDRDEQPMAFRFGNST
jgi:hypothetical protein